MELANIIISKIEREGPMSFRDYMEMALYYPNLGYYTSTAEKFGREGDYYTSPFVSTMYGQMLGRQIEEMWHLLGKKPLTIVEFGAGTAALANDILHSLQSNTDLYDSLSYVIIEKSASLREIQKHLPAEKVSWIDSIDEIAGFTGVVLSNEVLDNFAVHSVIMNEELMEVYVDYVEGEFTEILKPAGVELRQYLSDQGVTLPAGYRTEINLEAKTWIQDIGKSLLEGFVITVDYGYPARDYYSEKRHLGTLACYYKHTVTDHYYKNIGLQDITAHVNFTALDLYGKQAGLEFTGYCNQNYFLRSLGLIHHLRALETTIDDPETLQEVNKLILEMGDKFKVLIQHKNVRVSYLTGLQFSSKVPLSSV